MQEVSGMLNIVHMTVNGKEVELAVDPRESLLETLRNRLGLTSVKKGCEVGECGACTVIYNGEAVTSCLMLAGQVEGGSVITLEGVGRENGELDEIQQAFVEAGAVQCGYCTPGMILSAKALLDRNPKAGHEEIRRAMSGNLCRCTGYSKIIQAVEMARDAKGGAAV